jgi:hypothetical protein
MLKVTDLGCDLHRCRQCVFLAGDAELIKNVLFNLPREGDFHSYICEHGQTHCVIFSDADLESCGRMRPAAPILPPRPRARRLSNRGKPRG